MLADPKAPIANLQRMPENNFHTNANIHIIIARHAESLLQYCLTNFT